MAVKLSPPNMALQMIKMIMKLKVRITVEMMTKGRNVKKIMINIGKRDAMKVMTKNFAMKVWLKKIMVI